MARITSAEELRALYGEPMPVALQKEVNRLDKHCKRFIELSPFMLMGTTGPNRLGDVSPKGDAPGFVKVLDDRRIAIPDRKGNRRIDSLRNILDHPGVGLLFMIPGIDETLRVNGTAEIHVDPELNETLSARGQPALSALVVNVEVAFIHCGKALMRSDLWRDTYKIARADFPTIGEIIRDQAGDKSLPTEQSKIMELYKETL